MSAYKTYAPITNLILVVKYVKKIKLKNEKRREMR
jgi:hypothetical protein